MIVQLKLLPFFSFSMSSKNIYANTIAEYEAKGLLSQEQLRRIAGAGFEGAVKMLNAYGFFGDSHFVNKDIEGNILTQARILAAFVKENSSSADLEKLLLNPFYYSDARALFKQFQLGLDIGGLIILDNGEVRHAFEEQDYSGLPALLQDAISVLAKKNNLTAKDIDLAFLQAMYSDNIERARKIGAEFIKYCRTEIDFVNILTFYRAKKYGFDQKHIVLELFEGGEISLDPLEGFAPKDKYGDIIALLEADDFYGFSKITEEILHRIISGGKEGFFGYAPFVKYFYAKLSQLNTVKYILICLKNNIGFNFDDLRSIANDF